MRMISLSDVIPVIIMGFVTIFGVIGGIVLSNIIIIKRKQNHHQS